MGRSSVSTIIQRLEARGHRITAPRMAVVGVVASTSGHFTAEELAAKVRGVGRATIFRTLKLLVDEDLVCRVLLEDGNLHYRLGQMVHHHHLVCTQCGAVEDFTGCDVSDLIAALGQRTGFHIESHWLELYGRCASCGGRSEQLREAQPAGAV